MNKLQYMTDSNGHPTGVFLDIKYFEKLVEMAEDREAARFVTKLKKKKLEFVNWDNVVNEL